MRNQRMPRSRSMPIEIIQGWVSPLGLTTRIRRRRAQDVADTTDSLRAVAWIRLVPPLNWRWSCSSRLTCCSVIRWCGTGSRNRKSITQCHEAQRQEQLDGKARVATGSERTRKLQHAIDDCENEAERRHRQRTGKVERPAKAPDALRNEDTLICSAKVDEPELPVVGVEVVSIKCRCAHGIIVG